MTPFIIIKTRPRCTLNLTSPTLDARGLQAVELGEIKALGYPHSVRGLAVLFAWWKDSGIYSGRNWKTWERERSAELGTRGSESIVPVNLIVSSQT